MIPLLARAPSSQSPHCDEGAGGWAALGPEGNVTLDLRVLGTDQFVWPHDAGFCEDLKILLTRAMLDIYRDADPVGGKALRLANKLCVPDAFSFHERELLLEVCDFPRHFHEP